MRTITLTLMIVSLILLSGCANPFTKYQCWDGSTADSIDACPAPEVRQSCRESGGYLCGQSDGSAPPTIIRCAVEWLDSTESYCCPIECDKCDPEVLANCTTDNPCFNTRCDWATDFQCEISPIRPCDGNGICDKNEFGGYLEPPIIQRYNIERQTGISARKGLRSIGCYPSEDWDEQFKSSDTITNSTYVSVGLTPDASGGLRFSPCPDVGWSTCSHTSVGLNLTVGFSAPKLGSTKEDFVLSSSECPKSCPSDESPATVDLYDFTKQECVHTPCDFVCGNSVCEELEFFSEGTDYYTACFDDCRAEVEALEFSEDAQESEPAPEEIDDTNYLFAEYYDYQKFIKEDLEQIIGMDNLGTYGGREARYNGSVFFLMHKTGDWDFVYYWAVEVNAETGELIKYKDITALDGSRDRFNETWWTPER